MTHPTGTTTLIRQAEACLGRGARDEAADILAEATRVDPFDPEPPLLAAMLHVEAGRLGRAASAALEAIRIRPFHPSALNLLAVVCIDAGYPTQAKRILSRLLQQAPGFKQAKSNLKHLRRLKKDIEPLPGFPVEEVRLDRSISGLSVCIAIREGAPAVEATIESIDGVADQVVLVDATPGGALRDLDADGLTIVEATPTRDRAALLNRAIERADRGWILVLEPGETLTSSSRGKLVQALEHRRTLFHEVRVEDTAGRVRLAARLFRNAPGLAYSGCVLPTIRPALRVLAEEWRLGSARSGITLEAPDRDGRRYGSEEINASWLELRDDPVNPALALQFARLSAQTGNAAQALDTLKTIDDRFIDPEELVILQARCLLRLGRASEAQERIEAHHKKHAPTRNTLYLCGAASGANGEAATAVHALSKCSSLEAQDSTLAAIPELSSAALPNLYGAALMDLGRQDEAADEFGRALEIEPENVEARMGLLSLHMVRGEMETLLQQLDAWIDMQGDDPRVWSYGSVLLGRIPDLVTVHAQWASEACRRFPDDPNLRRQGVEALLSCGEIEAVLELLHGNALDRPADVAAQWAAALAAGADLPSIPPDAREEIENQVLLWLKVWMSHQRFEPLDRALLRIPTLGHELPGLPSRTASWLDQVGQQEAASRVRQAIGS